jgi:hypothetical protein
MKNFKNILTALLFLVNLGLVKKCEAIFTLSHTANTTVNLITLFPGTITASTSSTSVTGTGSNFGVGNVGDHVYAITTGATLRYLGTISSVTSTTAITLSSTANFAVSVKAYICFHPTNKNTLTVGASGNSQTSVVNFLTGYTFEDGSGNSVSTLTIPLNVTLGSNGSNRNGTLTLDNSSLRIEIGTLANGGNTGTLNITNGAVALTSTSTAGYTPTSPVTMSWSVGGNGTLNFNGYTIVAATYGRVIVENSVTSGAVTISESLSVLSGATLSMGANTLTLSAAGTTLTNSGTITTTAATPFSDSRSSKSYGGTVNLASSNGGQTILTGFTFNNLTLSNTSGTNTLFASATVTVDGTLTVTNPNMYLILNGGTLTVESFAGSGALTGSSTSSVVYTGETNSTMLMNTTTPGTTNALGNLTLNSNTNLTLGTALAISTALTITSGGTLAMGNNTLSVTTTLSNSGKISTTCPTATSATPLTLPAGTWGGTIEYASANAQTVMGGTYTNLTLSGSGTKSTGSTINVGKVYTSESGKLQINSSGSLNITGTLSSNEIHSVGASIELNGGDFIVSGIKNKDQTYSATAGTTPYMIIKSDIVDVLASGFRSNSIQFIPSNTSTEVSHIRFVGSGLDLGNSSSFNSTVKANAAAYFEIGDGSTSTDLTLMDTLRLFNGLRTRVNSSLVTGGMLILNSDKTSIPGKGQSGNASNGVPIGYLDTCVASTISGNVKLTLTFSARRKIRFLGNPFSANLSITDFTDEIDITGDRSGTNNNNFTATASNAPSAYTYSNSSDAWVAITNTTPTVLNSLQGMRILVRGVKGYGLDANNGSPVESRLVISGNPILGDQTINLLEGFNFITNPFLSIVDIGKVTKSTNVADVIYMYAPASSGYQTFNRNSKAVSSGGSACWSPGTSIFFYASTTGESIGVPEGAKVSPTKQSYNSHFGELDTLNNIGNVVVKNILERQSLTDGITLDFSGSRNATDDFEPLFDGVDLGSDSVNVSVVSSNGKFLSYQATNPLAGQEVRRYPLKVEIRNSSLNGAYILMFDQFKAFTSDLSVLLVDKWLNTTTDLIAKPEYAFQISNDINSQGSGRFEIVVSNKSTVDVQDIIKGSASDFFVFNSPLDECVTFTAIGNGSNKSLRVLDLQGKLIKEYKDFQSPITLSSNEISRGIYIATVVSGQNKSTKKFIF